MILLHIVEREKKYGPTKPSWRPCLLQQRTLSRLIIADVQDCYCPG
jgi:hypothetical protein